MVSKDKQHIMLLSFQSLLLFFKIYAEMILQSVIITFNIQAIIFRKNNMKLTRNAKGGFYNLSFFIY